MFRSEAKRRVEGIQRELHVTRSRSHGHAVLPVGLGIRWTDEDRVGQCGVGQGDVDTQREMATPSLDLICVREHAFLARARAYG